MKFTFTIVPIIIFSLFIQHSVEARILHVPGQYRTINGAIERANDGDTVLVAPGEYVENVDYIGREITVASLLLTTGDRAYIDSTIIDGNNMDATVAFNNEEGENAVLQGFTITGGRQMFGGGIDVQSNANPQLLDLLVTGNHASEIGGGIYCTWYAVPRIERVTVRGNTGRNGAGIASAHEAHPVIVDCEIYDNEADDDGGGLFAGHGDGEFTLEYVSIYNNSATRGGAIYLDFAGDCILRNVQITGNTAETAGAMMVNFTSWDSSRIELTNCILFDNSMPQIRLAAGDEDEVGVFAAAYCDIEGGIDSMVVAEENSVEWGEGNIDADPMFADADELDFSLLNHSPCIDSGDPDSPFDVDSTRVDMGVIPFLERGTLHGFVFDSEDEEPLGWAIVTTSYLVSAQADSSGYWSIPRARAGMFDITAEYNGFNPETLGEQVLEESDSLEITFRLDHPEFRLSIADIRIEVDSLSPETEVDFTLENRGNSNLEWTAEAHNYGNSGKRPWLARRRFGIEIGENNITLKGAIFVENSYYLFLEDVNGSWISLFDREVEEELGRFRQDVNLVPRRVDLAWDGEIIWIAADDSLLGFTTDGNLLGVHEFQEMTTGIAWDEDEENYWVSFANGEIASFDRDFEEVDRFDLPDVNITGLAYWADDEDEMPIYIYHFILDSAETVIKIDPEIGELTFVWQRPIGTPHQSGSAFITDQYDHFHGWVTLLCSYDEESNSFFEVYQLQEANWWMDLDLAMGELEPDMVQNLNVGLTAMMPEGGILDTGRYDGQIRFRHNAMGGQTLLRIYMQVIASESVDGTPLLPLDFGITAAYPNPFNPSLTLEYTLPRSGNVRLVVYDLAGRIVDTIVDGRRETGRHRVNFDATTLPSGVYITRLEAGGETAVRKVVCMK